jgi:hypothetical protein
MREDSEGNEKEGRVMRERMAREMRRREVIGERGKLIEMRRREG